MENIGRVIISALFLIFEYKGIMAICAYMAVFDYPPEMIKQNEECF
jgi:hypothetical protein